MRHITGTKLLLIGVLLIPLGVSAQGTQINLQTRVKGLLPPANGGLGTTPTVANQVPVSTSSSSISYLTLPGTCALDGAHALNYTPGGGFVCQVISGSGAVTGSGTTGYLPLWSGATTLGNSLVDYGVTTASTFTFGNTSNVGFAVKGTGISLTSTGNTSVSTTGSLVLYSTALFSLSGLGGEQITNSDNVTGLQITQTGTAPLALSAVDAVNITAGTTLTLGGTAVSITAPTTATSSSNISSALLEMSGSYWNGTSSAADTWTWVGTLGTGTNPTSTYALSHNGTSGAAAVSIPYTLSTGAINASGGYTQTGLAPNTFSGGTNFTGGSVGINAVGFYITGSTDASVSGGAFWQMAPSNTATSSNNYSSTSLDYQASYWTGTLTQRAGFYTQAIPAAGSNPLVTLAHTFIPQDSPVVGGSATALETWDHSISTAGYQVNGTALAATNLSNGTTGSGAVVLASSPTLTTPTATGSVSTPMVVGTEGATIAPLSAAGTGATASCFTGSGNQCTASSGFVELTTGTSPSIGLIFTVSWTTPMPHPVNCVVSPGGGAPPETSAALSPGANNYSTTSFGVDANAAPAASTNYYFTYVCGD